MKIKILDIAYHRNGVAGEGFYAVLFNEKTEGKMVATIFPQELLFNGGINPRCAVYSIEKLSQSNIAFGDNSYRGDSYYDQIKVAAAQFYINEPENYTDFLESIEIKKESEESEEIETIQS